MPGDFLRGFINGCIISIPIWGLIVWLIIYIWSLFQ